MSDNPFTDKVRVKYIPIADNYKGAPLVSSITGDHDGRDYAVRATLNPGEEKVVPVCIARDLKRQVAKFNRNKNNVNVPDGSGIESRMVTEAYNSDEGGVRSQSRKEYNQPDYELVVYGDI